MLKRSMIPWICAVPASRSSRRRRRGPATTASSKRSAKRIVIRVGGNFTLDNKGSGDVSVHGVRGQVRIPDYKQ